MIISPGIIIHDGEDANYKVLEQLGVGGFGVVYKIQKEDDGSIWALKTLPTALPSQEMIKAFENEANLAVTISHDNVIEYFYIHNGRDIKGYPPFIIMEYADHGSLLDLLDDLRANTKFISNEELNNLYLQIISGMMAINEKLIHRDIKPGNILLKGNTIKISDFGLAKISGQKTRTMTFKGFGTEGYLAPEGWQSGKNTIQMDIYSMGIVFFELATLTHPLNSDKITIDDWRNAHLFQAPKDPRLINSNLTSVHSQLLLNMIEKSTQKRFKSWDDIAAFLKRSGLSEPQNNHIVTDIVEHRLKVDVESNRIDLEERKKESEISEFQQRIIFQIKNEIISDIDGLIKEFNDKYVGEDMVLEEISPWRYAIHLISGNKLQIHFQPILEKDFYRDVPARGFGETRTVRRLMKPRANNRELMAWGVIKGPDGGGINLLLLEQEDDIYGLWNCLINVNSGFSMNPRKPEPFAFDFNELEKEIHNINVTHIYVISPEQYNIRRIADLIKAYI